MTWIVEEATDTIARSFADEEVTRGFKTGEREVTQIRKKKTGQKDSSLYAQLPLSLITGGGASGNLKSGEVEEIDDFGSGMLSFLIRLKC